VLAQTHLRDEEITTLTVSESSALVALVVTYRAERKAIPLPVRELRAISECHSGRAGLIARSDDPDVVECLLANLLSQLSGWDVFTFGVVEGSRSHIAVSTAANHLSLDVRCVSRKTSPYIVLPASWEQLLAQLPKKFRWTLKKSERDLSERGMLNYEEATEPAHVRSLLEAIYEIEKDSWKEDEGTSILSSKAQKSFYESLAEMAGQGGCLSGHVLRLNGEPISYIFGLLSEDGVFLDQKESFKKSFAAYSPGHVLKRFAIPRLLSRGVRLYDFMGDCESYKMRWTSQTYDRLGLAIYNRTWRGALCRLRSVFSQRARLIATRSRVSSA